MRVLPMALYTDKRRVKHGAPTPHAIVTWRRDGDVCKPYMMVVDINGDVAMVGIEIADYMAGSDGTGRLSDAATYLLDMLHEEDAPDYEPGERDVERAADRCADVRGRHYG